MKKLLTRLVSLAWGSIAVVALLATILGFAIPASAWDQFDTSKTYVIDASACTWLEDSGTRLQVSENNGGTWNSMTRISTGIYAYKPTTSTDWLKFKRVYSTGSDHEFGYNCPVGQSAYTYIKIKSDCTGVESHSPVRNAGYFITSNDSWGSTQNYMGWDDAQQAYTYTAAKGGNFMVSTNSNFWDGRLKLTNNGKDIPSTKPSNANLTSDNSNDGTLNITEAGTIYFQPFANKIWYNSNGGGGDTTDPSKAGKMYLITKLMNDEFDSPAWELVRKTDGTYFLDEFALRAMNENDYKLAVYDASGKRTVRTIANKEGWFYYDNDDINDDGQRQPGWLSTATYYPTQDKIVFNSASSGNVHQTDDNHKKTDVIKDIFPYVGVLGTNFVQAQEKKTRHNATDNADNKTYFGLGDSGKGWQEAYVEYSNGLPLLDDKGRYIYNTVWPPRNNILMQSFVGNAYDRLNVSSDDLTLAVEKDGGNVVRKTGSEWKSYLKDYDAEKYTGLYNASADNGGLESGKTYVRLSVNDTWMLGAFKIWTGWGGEKVWRNNGGGRYEAQWNNFMYWGPDAVDDSRNDNGSDDKNELSVKFNTPYKTQSGHNFRTDNKGKKREYYGSIELFLPYKDSNKTEFDYYGARVYFTKAALGANIDSHLSKDEATKNHVGYNPDLSAFTEDYTVTGYKIYRYRYNPDVNRKDYIRVDKNNNPTEKDKNIVDEKSGLSIAGGVSANDTFRQNFTFGLKNNTYVDDGEYASGRYIFKMVVYATQNGEKKEVEVWSPYVEIISDTYEIGLEAVQLIKLPESGHELGDYNYVTYSANKRGYLVKTNAANQVENMDIATVDQVDKVAEVYDKSGTWTNNVLLLSEVPKQYHLDGKKREITEFSVKENGSTVADLKNGPENRFGSTKFDRAAIYIGATDPKKTTYTATFNASITTLDDKTLTPSATKDAVYTPTFPLPYLETPKFKMVEHEKNQYWNDGDFSGLNEWKFTHEHVDGENISAKKAIGHELQMEVPVHIPNIDASVKSKVLDILAADIVLDGEKYPVKAVGNASNYRIVYRNQNPYNWLKENVDRSDKNDAKFWTADEHRYSMDGSYTDIGTYKPSAPKEVLAQLDPQFVAPPLEFGIYGDLYGGDEPFNPDDYLSYPYQDKMYACLYLTGITYPNSGSGLADSGSGSSASLYNGEDFLETGEKSVYVLHATNNSYTHADSENTAVDVSFAFQHKEDIFTDVFTTAKGKKIKGKLIAKDVVFIPKKTSDGKPAETPQQIQTRIAEWMNSVEIEIGFAHMFDATANDGNKVAESHYDGFIAVDASDGPTFPEVKRTVTSVPERTTTQIPDTQVNYFRRGSYGKESKELGGGDSWLLSPIYKVKNVSKANGNITTGIGEIVTDEATDAEPVYYNLQGVRVQNPGKGLYIKVTGNRSEKVIL